MEACPLRVAQHDWPKRFATRFKLWAAAAERQESNRANRPAARVFAGRLSSATFSLPTSPAQAPRAKGAILTADSTRTRGARAEKAAAAPGADASAAMASAVGASTAGASAAEVSAAEVSSADALAWRSINAIRALAMDAVEAAQSGHPGTPMALAPAAYVLWHRFLRYNPTNPDWPDRDRFVLSCGHASMLQYALLHLTGYDL